MNSQARNTIQFLHVLEQALANGHVVVMNRSREVEAGETLGLLRTVTALRTLVEVHAARDATEMVIESSEVGDL